MNNYRKNGVTAGVLLLAAIVTGVVGVVLTNNIFSSMKLLTLVAEQSNRVLLGSSLFIAMAFCCTGIAVWLYPALKRHNPAMAMAAVAFRTLEGVLFIVTAISKMQLVNLAKYAMHADLLLDPNMHLLGDMLLAEGNWFGGVGGALGFCMGALFYYIIMIQSRIVPRWLSIWGLVAILMHLVSVVLIIIGGGEDTTFTTLLNLPIFLNELVLAGWLIARGFDFSYLKPALVTE